MKEIKKQICKTTYEGNCPICGIEQTSAWKHSVDVKCGDCSNKEYIEKCNNDLLGAVVISVNSESCEMTSITLKKRGESTNIVIEVKNHYEDPPEMVYNVIEDGE